MLEEYPLFALCPFDVLVQDTHLNLLAVGDAIEAVEECTDYPELINLSKGFQDGWNALSFAVFAFAIDETNPRERLMTSAIPWALLQRACKFHEEPWLQPLEYVLLVTV